MNFDLPIRYIDMTDLVMQLFNLDSFSFPTFRNVDNETVFIVPTFPMA